MMRTKEEKVKNERRCATERQQQQPEHEQPQHAAHEENERHQDSEYQNGDPLTGAFSEHEPRMAPRIYVASLSDYNAGNLHGSWLDAAVDNGELWSGIQTMLANSPELGAEEWAIHDYDDFGPLHLGEYENLEAVATIARGIAEHGEAFAHWASLIGIDQATATGDEHLADRFAEEYLGLYDSTEAYAEQLLDDLGYTQQLEQAIPEHLQPYVALDVAAFARDLELGGDITVSRGDDGVFVFEGNR